MKVGVLALQGAFIEHINMLNSLNIQTFEIRQKKDIDKSFDALILPGGESTAMGKLLDELQLLTPLKHLIENDMPTFGTCAGLILLAKDISNFEKSYFKTLNVSVKRNAYGRQLGSFTTFQNFDNKKIEMRFIRAPYIENVYDGVDILSIVDGNIVAVRQKNQLATSFHPELTKDTFVHEYFIKMIKNKI